jgi:type I site-specific restriction-modification system R (restriction) subunit
LLKGEGDAADNIVGGPEHSTLSNDAFPSCEFDLDAIGSEHRGHRFAIIIDEAHSSQGGRTSAAVSIALGKSGEKEDDESIENKINRIVEAKPMLSNASYFAFTATPKNKTLEIFGQPEPQADGTVKHRPFHSYTMKQAIQEGLILDVLRYNTPVMSYYRLVKRIEGDPNKPHDLMAALDGYQVYSTAQINDFVAHYLNGADRDRLDPILDGCVAVYCEQLDEDGQVDFKGKAKAFRRSLTDAVFELTYATAAEES